MTRKTVLSVQNVLSNANSVVSKTGCTNVISRFDQKNVRELVWFKCLGHIREARTSFARYT